MWYASFSLRAHIWRTIENNLGCTTYMDRQGIVSNGALHWLNMSRYHVEHLVAFDLDKEEFRIMKLPNFGREDGGISRNSKLGVVGGCLCISSLDTAAASESIDFWVMKQYDVCDSWTRLYNLDFSGSPAWPLLDQDFGWLFFESSALGMILAGSEIALVWIESFDQKENEKFELVDVYISEGSRLSMVVEYEESLAWIEE